MFLLVVLLFVVLLLPLTSTSGGLGTLSEPMFKLPVVATVLPRPGLEVARKLFAVGELLVGRVPAGFETGEKGVLFRFMAIVGPEVLVVGYRRSVQTRH